MKQRFILFRRASVFYCEDSVTRKQLSLKTKDEAEARTLLNAKNESLRQPHLNLQIARTYLTAADPAIGRRTWQCVMDQMQTHGKESTQIRCERAMKSEAFDRLRQVKLIETNAEDFLTVLNGGRVSANHYLRRLHNLALGLGWLFLYPPHPANFRANETSAATRPSRSAGRPTPLLAPHLLQHQPRGRTQALPGPRRHRLQ